MVSSGMGHAVFVQNPQSIYKDKPGELYHFPRRYLGMVREAVGDWVIFYEGRAGAFGYVGVQKLLDVVADPTMDAHYFAVLDLGSLLDFEQVVPRADPLGRAYEACLRGEDGRPISGGANTSAVRRLDPLTFSRIVDAGLTPLESADSLPRDGPLPEATGERAAGFRAAGFAEAPGGFAPPGSAGDRETVLTSRKKRDAAFARMVKAAYGGRCAVSGLMLRNGGGRPEVQAAHIRPVKDGGPDVVRNGLALSGTLHWMFDRGLISVGEDMRILISHNKVPRETARRLIAPEQRLILPRDPRHHPHPAFLRYHREQVFGQLG